MSADPATGPRRQRADAARRVADVASRRAGALLVRHRRPRAAPARSGHRRARLLGRFRTEVACCVPAVEGGLLLALRSGIWRFDAASGERRAGGPAALDPGRTSATTMARPTRSAASGAARSTSRARRPRPRSTASRAAGPRAWPTGITVSNGLAFSPDGRTLYWADTTAHTVYAFDFDVGGNDLSRRRVHAQFPEAPARRADRELGGRPDGAAVDSHGRYWVAMYEGARCCAWPPTAARSTRCALPVRCPTMPCFGGPDLRTLYVTSVRHRPAGRRSGARAARRLRARPARRRRGCRSTTPAGASGASRLRRASFPPTGAPGRQTPRRRRGGVRAAVPPPSYAARARRMRASPAFQSRGDQTHADPVPIAARRPSVPSKTSDGRHSFTVEAAQAMADAVRRGNGTMAQFDHPEFSGSGQWMRGGMTMVSSMSDHNLKSRVSALAEDVSAWLSKQPAQSASSSSQGRQPDSGSGRSGGSGNWWPDGLSNPASSGSQNNQRYAYFPDQRRLVVDIDGEVSVYDTQDHRIGGVSQQQSGSGSMKFQSQHGTVEHARPAARLAQQRRRPLMTRRGRGGLRGAACPGAGRRALSPESRRTRRVLPPPPSGCGWSAWLSPPACTISARPRTSATFSRGASSGCVAVPSAVTISAGRSPRWPSPHGRPWRLVACGSEMAARSASRARLAAAVGRPARNCPSRARGSRARPGRVRFQGGRQRQPVRAVGERHRAGRPHRAAGVDEVDRHRQRLRGGEAGGQSKRGAGDVLLLHWRGLRSESTRTARACRPRRSGAEHCKDRGWRERGARNAARRAASPRFVAVAARPPACAPASVACRQREKRNQPRSRLARRAAAARCAPCPRVPRRGRRRAAAARPAARAGRGEREPDRSHRLARHGAARAGDAGHRHREPGMRTRQRAGGHGARHCLADRAVGVDQRRRTPSDSVLAAFCR